MGIKTAVMVQLPARSRSLKNLPTTWGLRPFIELVCGFIQPLKNLPTTWGLRLLNEVV